MKIRYILTIATIISSFSAAAFADDLRLVTVESQSDLTAVNSVLNRAFVRADRKFLVSVNAEQSAQLEKLGLTLETVLTNINPEQVIVVYPQHAGVAKLVAPTTLGLTVALENGLTLLYGTSFSAETLSATTGLKTRLLSDLSVPFLVEQAVVIHPTPAAFPSDTIVNRVKQDSVYFVDSRLEAFYTRYTYTDSVTRARDWIKSRFQTLGYFDVSLQPCYYLSSIGRWANNIKAIKYGTSEPDKIIIVGAHYDSYSSNAWVIAPGADDNGSGTTVVLELARVLANIPLRKTIIFMAFDAEELGLYGSTFAARDFKQSGAKVEAMFNFDMVGFTNRGPWYTDLESGPNQAYMQAMIDAAGRVTGLLPSIAPMQNNSDHAPFSQQGFPIGFAIEGYFNTPNYHRPSDSTTRMDFPFLTDIVKMAAATVAYTADAASPVVIDSIIDQGDARGLRVFWANCRPEYQYVVNYGFMTGTYTHSVNVPSGACSQLITGAFGGQRVYVSVAAVAPSGYAALYTTESSEVAQVAPRAPTSVAAAPEPDGIRITWAPNHEADMDHYDLYRTGGYDTTFSLLQSGLTTPSYFDLSALRWTRYGYRVVAVDHDNIPSAFSKDVYGAKATFDHGVVIVDEYTQDSESYPTTSQHKAYCDSLFGTALHDVVLVDSLNKPMTRDRVAPYSSIFWFDDDIVSKFLVYNRDNLNWYFGYHTNMLLSGLETIRQFCGVVPIGSGNLMYDQFMLQGFTTNNPRDFAAAKGQLGWPTIQFDSTRGMRNMGDIPSLVARPGGQVIYTYHSSTNDPARENAPVGIAYDGPNGRRILLAFPLYYMTPASASAFIAAARSYFHESGVETPRGDLDGNGFCDLTDLFLLLDFLGEGVPFATPLSSADVDASCSVDISDVFYIIDYLAGTGPAPLAGCVPRPGTR